MAPVLKPDDMLIALDWRNLTVALTYDKSNVTLIFPVATWQVIAAAVNTQLRYANIVPYDDVLSVREH